MTRRILFFLSPQLRQQLSLGVVQISVSGNKELKSSKSTASVRLELQNFSTESNLTWYVGVSFQKNMKKFFISKSFYREFRICV